MDEKELLQQRIKELEDQVRQLKVMLPAEKPPKRAMCPKAVAEKHGGLLKEGKAWEYNHFPFMSYKDLMSLTNIIRRCCFLRNKKNRTYVSADSYNSNQFAESFSVKQLNCDVGKTLKELSDEEYAKYCEVLDKLLDVFEEYGCTHNDNW